MIKHRGYADIVHNDTGKIPDYLRTDSDRYIHH